MPRRRTAPAVRRADAPPGQGGGRDGNHGPAGQPAGGITGGVAASGPGTCARVIPFEAIGRGDVVRTFWEARGEGFPAVCVARVGSDVRELVSVHSALRVHRFRVYIVSARLDGDDERVEELELLVD